MNRLSEHRIFIVGGAGGVGKTTTAAALGIRLAEKGFKTIVLTVDPAKRLAQALGLDALHKDVQQVNLPSGVNTLYVSMLDTQRYFDRVIERFSKNETQKQKILNNPIYRTMVDHLGGTEEYAAMERLLEFSLDPQFEKIVIDTPPSQNAVDLLSSPKRLADFMDNSVLRWFQGKQPYYLKLFKQGTKLAMKALQLIFGAEFLEAFSKLMDDFDGMQTGFQNRHQKVIELLKSPELAFLLVTLATESRYQESESFMKSLKENQISLKAIIVNQIESPSESAKPATNEPIRTKKAQDPKWMELQTYYESLFEAQQKWMTAFGQLQPQVLHFEIPRNDITLHDIASLSKLGTLLIN